MLGDGHMAGSGAERAEARGLADLTLRRLGQVDDVLARFVERPPKRHGRQILRIMAAEILFAGTPPFAAVDLAVRLARDGKATNRLTGLINAVGRRIGEQGPEIVVDQDAAALNMPAWLLRRVETDWGTRAARQIAEAHLAPPPHDLSLRDPKDGRPLAREIGGVPLPSGTVRLDGRPQITALPGYADGAWWVQDAAAAMPARLVQAKPGMRVLDLCAAPGGKTMQLAAAGADVTALDASQRRMARLQANLERTGLDARLVVADLFDWTPDQPYDAILLDAPCSATGTIRRHPDLPHRTDGDALADLTALQAAMLDRAFAWLKPGGTLVYCTCSLFRAEGEEQIATFLNRTDTAATLPLVDRDGIPMEFRTSEGWMRTLPHQWADLGGLDGFFTARVARAA